MNFTLCKIALDRPFALGATLGQDCMSLVAEELEASEHTDTGLLLDLTRASGVNASFLKATVYWALQCGQAHVQQKERIERSAWAVRPLRLYPLITGCKGEVSEDVHEFFAGRKLPILHVVERNEAEIVRACVMGTLDPVLVRTLAALEARGEGTAADLAGRSHEKITINGWNNRLADLHLLRLAKRRRDGKFWIYTPTAKGTILCA